MEWLALIGLGNLVATFVGLHFMSKTYKLLRVQQVSSHLLGETTFKGIPLGPMQAASMHAAKSQAIPLARHQAAVAALKSGVKKSA